MIILLVNSIEVFGASASGAERLFRDINDSIQRNNIVETCIPNGVNNIFRVKNKLLRKLFFDYINPIALFQFLRILRRVKPDVVHFHSFYGISSSLAFLSTLLAYSTVITAHDYWSFCYWATMLHNGELCNYCTNRKIRSLTDFLHHIHTKLNLFLMKDCTFVAPSLYMQKQLKEHGFRAVHVPNGILLSDTISRYKKTVIWVGRLVPEKGLEEIIPFMNMFLSQNPDWQFLVLGDGPLLNELQLKYPKIQFLGKVDPARYYESASIFINSSVWNENLSFSILEAMSYGILPIVTRVGGSTDMVEDGYNGYVYDPKKPEQILEILEKATDRNNIEEMGRRSRQIIQEKFSMEKCISGYEELYKKILSETSNKI